MFFVASDAKLARIYSRGDCDESPRPQREGRNAARRAETDCPSVECPSTEVRPSEQEDRDFRTESS